MPFIWLSHTLISMATSDITPGLPWLPWGLRHTVLCDVGYILRLKEECLCLRERVFSVRYGQALSQVVSRWYLPAES